MRILVGKIVRPQGCNGELKVYPNDTNLNIYKNLKHIYFENSEEPVVLTHLSLRQDFMYITFKACKSRNDAENYRNKKIYADEQDLNLGEGTYFVEKLMDLDVVDEYGNSVGTIVDIENYGSADIITILEGTREYKVSFLTSIFVKVTNDIVVVNRQKYEEGKVCE